MMVESVGSLRSSKAQRAHLLRESSGGTKVFKHHLAWVKTLRVETLISSMHLRKII